MRVAPDADEIRGIVVQVFEDLGVVEPRADLEESIMIDAGRYVARTYRSETFMAMWLIDVGLVQFYDEEGAMLRTVNLFDEWEPQRLAA